MSEAVVDVNDAASTVDGTVALSSDNENISSVDERLLKMFDDYCRLAAERRKNSCLSMSAYADLFTIAIHYGFGHMPYKYFDTRWQIFLNRLLQIRGVVMRPLNNIGLALNELSEQEASFGFADWVLRFLTPYLYADVPPAYQSQIGAMRIRQRLFRKQMFDLREAVLCDDWPRVGALIGCVETIRLNPKEFSVIQRRLIHRTVYSKFAPFSVTIFHAGVQRLMQHNIPRSILAKSIAEFMLVMIGAEKNCERQNVRSRNCSLLYLCDVLIFLIANGLQEDANDLVAAVSSISAVAQTKPLMLTMRGYKALHRYEVWRTGDTDEEPPNAITLVDELIYAINELPPGEATVFVDAMVHLLGSLDLSSTILEVLSDCCTKTPFMLAHAHHALLTNGLQAEAEQLLDTVITSCLEISASDPILLEWVQPRLLNPQNFDVLPEVMLHICKILFEFLDYGENRNNERAWAFLWACVQFVGDSEVLHSHWQLRHDWWLKFHCVPLSSAGNECRSKVLNLLEHLS